MDIGETLYPVIVRATGLWAKEMRPSSGRVGPESVVELLSVRLVEQPGSLYVLPAVNCFLPGQRARHSRNA